MIPAFSCFLALRYLLTRWVNLLGILGIGVAVWALIVVVAIFSGFIDEIRANIHGATADLLVTNLASESSFEEIEPILRADLDVLALAPRLRHYAIYYPRQRGNRIQITPGLATSPLMFAYIELLGLDPTLEAQTTDFSEWLTLDQKSMQTQDLERPFSSEGSLIGQTRALRKDPGILLSRSRARGSRLMRGHKIEIVSARLDPEDLQREPLKIRKFFVFSGAFETKHRLFDETKALIPIESLREMLGHHPYDSHSIDLISDVALRIDPSADLKVVAARLEQSLVKDHPHCRVLTWEEQNAEFLAAVEQERGMMKLVLFAVMLVASFLIYATQHMMVSQKIKDIGIISSMGASSAGILMVFLIIGVIIATTGCLLGTITGCLSAFYLNDINEMLDAAFGFQLFPTDLYDLDSIPYLLEAGWISQVIIGALSISLLAGLLPARRAARMDPVQALAYE